MSAELLRGWEPDPLESEGDLELVAVYQKLRTADPDGTRTGRLMRRTLDQLYDGQRTGRYSWAELHKTERTHFGTLFEINLRREFDDVIDEGEKLDYRIADVDVDCKFSQRMNGWMIPPEALGHLLVVGYVSDAKNEFALGVVRATLDHCRIKPNRDAKVQLNQAGREAVRWLQRPGDLPPNVLLDCDAETLAAIFSPKSGQKRVNELLRRVTGRRIGRNVIATVAQQDDFMKRVRANGGARTTLRPEGYVILGGDYEKHRVAARQLGVEAPEPGEVVSIRLVPATDEDPFVAEFGGQLWRLADEAEISPVEAPDVPFK
ncbi:NaeI family type II restriction endonuclease [Microbacterium hydrocarbonoxydans]|uniref:NaeI family type II restriction endonuclease n=1 Tax=Microbacterium hydrocarbonoxydans TaxID=273678 RepID=UPI0020412CC2|nr:NaeI family type II restriction endonuclease [Microbacterium hydrocarbonoxydans]MCM3778397.1 NaeI family type II restriction endonuclease [Microbacterium hydrocarbonoxydans]